MSPRPKHKTRRTLDFAGIPWPETVAPLAAFMQAAQDQADRDPTANPILGTALYLADSLAAGEVTHAMLEAAIQHGTADAFLDRADRLRAYMGETDEARNIARLHDLFAGLASRLPFEDFKALVESELFGLVVTAHPTFSTGTELLRLLNRLATEPVGDAERGVVHAAAERLIHRPDPDLSLDSEHALSVDALTNMRHAIGVATRVLLDAASQAYPEHWRGLRPRPLTLASWVGYDLDGRSDISFADMLAKRAILQGRQIALLSQDLLAVETHAGDDDFARLQADLAEAAAEIARDTEVFAHFQGGDVQSHAAIRDLSRHLSDTAGGGQVTTASLLETVESLIARADDATARQLIPVAAELANNGMALARTHVRINSTQLHNAIRKTVSLETAPDDARYRQGYVNAINALIAEVQPVTINFGSLLAERTSAKRLFMTVAQMLKYMDGSTPVRFLIAECETAFTPLVALYYARLFGVAERLEICPLFETEKGLQNGSRVIEQLIESPHFRAYLKEVGRLCIQTGYSDAGRFIGQPAATGSIERLKERIVHSLKRHNLDVQLVFFDTHGESVGRGGHPGGLKHRFAYLQPPHVMRLIEEAGIAYKQESSFQGGDGYVYFLNQPGALAVVTSILEWRLAQPDDRHDLFYAARDYVTEFLTGIKTFQDGLIADPDYGVLLGTFGTNLLYRTGSRATKRQDPSEKQSRPQISQFRAIPHNAVLQQLGMLTNTLGGAGEAIAHDPDQFFDLYRTSPRFRAIMDMVRHADGLSDPDTLKAYVDTLDPGLWLLREAGCDDAERGVSYGRLADALEEWGVHTEQARMFRHLFKDFIILRDGLQTLDTQAPYEAVSARCRMSLALLNAIRIAIVHEIFRLGTLVPEFSSRNDVANRRLFLQILQLDIPAAVASLKEIFPSHPAPPESGDFGEAATYAADDRQGYEHETVTVFEPMLALYELLRRIGTAVAYRDGFIG